MEYRSNFRLGVFLSVFGILLCLYAFRMFQLQVSNPRTADNTTGTYTYDTRVTAARGELLDRNGIVLIHNRASYNIIITNFALFNSENPNESLRQLVNLCRELSIDYNDHFPLTEQKPYEYTTAEYSDTWNGYFRRFLRENDWDSDVSAAQLMKLMRKRFRIPNDWTDQEVRGVLGLRYELDLRNYTALPTYTLLSDVDAIRLAEIMELNTPGMRVESSTVRELNTTYAAHILGRTGDIFADDWPEYKDKGYSMDAKVGIDGMDKAFEAELHGTDGILRTTVDKEGNVIAQYYAKEPKAGCNVETTIDINLQMVAEEALEDMILSLRENGVNKEGEGKDAEGGAVVVQDVKTGAILACASYPTFNLATFNQDYAELSKDKLSPMFNRALLQIYPPGSIYKMATSIAAIDSGTIGPYYKVRDQGIYTYYDEYQPACYLYTASQMTHGTIDCVEALAVSCNYYFYEVGRLTGWRQMDAVAKALGLGEKTGVEVPEATGWRANPDTKKEVYSDPAFQTWVGGDVLSMAIGQSENRFTPLQMVVYTSALANRGVRYKATFLNRVITADYQSLVYEMEPEIENTLEISDEAYRVYTQGMRMAAQDRSGTAYKVFGDYSIPVSAKTGTAQHGAGGSDHASFVCYAPSDDPQIAVAIYVEKGAQGGNLGTIARTIFDTYFATEYENDVVAAENAMN